MNPVNQEPAFPPAGPLSGAQADRLDSWKEIAAYLGRSERTVRRWEDSEGLPVHRLQHEKRGSVFAYRTELDRWWEMRKASIETEPESQDAGTETAPNAPAEARPLQPTPRIPARWGAIALAFAILALALALWKFRPYPVAAGRIKSIAVLPLRNLSGDANQEYFTDGATDALISNLAQIRSLRVISFTSVIRYKGTNKPLPEIGRELGVDGVVEGSVQQEGGRVRISAQLVEAATDTHVWAQVYDRERSDMLSAQAEVARSIAQEIRGRLTPEENSGLTPRTVTSAAHDEYMLGHDHIWKLTERDQLEALRHFQEAVRLQPDYSEAYAQIAAVWLARALFTGGVRLHDAERPAWAAIDQALEFGPNLALAHDIHADLLMYYKHDWAGAEAEYQRAIALNTNSFDARADHACLLGAVGNFPEMFRELDRAVALDPQNSFIEYIYGDFSGLARQWDRAEQHYRRALELDPKSIQAQRGLIALTGFAKGDPARAMTMLEEQAQARGGNVEKDFLAGMFYSRMGRRADALKVLANLTAPGARIGPGALASLYFELGDLDHGFQALEKMFGEGNNIFAAHQAQWDTVRADPRFQAQIRRLGLPQ